MQVTQFNSEIISKFQFQFVNYGITKTILLGFFQKRRVPIFRIIVPQLSV